MSTALAVRHGRFGRAAIYRLNRAFLTHAHREGHLTFHLEGEAARITVAGVPYPLDPGSALAIDPWQPHSFDLGTLDNDDVVALVLYIAPTWFLGDNQTGQCLRFGRPTVAVSPSVAPLVHRLGRLLLGEAESNDFEGHLRDLTSACFEQTWSRIAVPLPPPQSQTYRDYRIRNSIRLMQKRIGDELAIDLIARDVGLSRPHFYKLFRQHVGITPNIFLNTLRMEAAIDRLTQSSDPVTSIGLDLGFASQASFTRFFCTNVGVPPSDYRRVAFCRT
jgi:AraC-like DNA-binding protein